MQPQELAAAVSDSMTARTGRTLDEWVAVVEADGPDPLDQKAVRAWLKGVHGIAQNTQWAITFAAAEQNGWRMPSPDELADTIDSGCAVVLRPLHDAVVATALGLGDDVEVEGRATDLPIVRATQRADERLEPSKGFAQATHWVHPHCDADPAAAAASIEPLLRAAYAQNGR